MNNTDHKLSLFLGKPVFVDEIGSVYSPTLNEIESIKLNTYYYYLSIIINKSDQFDSYGDYFDALIKYKENQYRFTKAVAFFTKSDFIFSEELSSFISTSYYKTNNDSVVYCKINKGNFVSFVNAIKLINHIKIEEEVRYFNNRAKQMAEKFKQLREKYSKAFNKEDDLDYTDIISTVASRHPSINLLNIGELTLYQLIDKFRRLHNIDEYHINIQALMNGAKDIKLEHYSKKLS